MLVLVRGACLALAALVVVTATAGVARAGPLGQVQQAAPLGFSDDEITRAVLEELARDAHHVSVGVRASVSGGIVELRGSLPLPSWRERAERVARVVHGVRAVVNRILVVPKRRRDADVLRDVRRAVRTTPGLVALPIQVEVQNGIVELSGSITSWEEQQLAERVARGVVGVRSCENQLISSSRIARRGAILAGDVRSRLDWDPLVQHDPIRVDVRGTRVWLSGNVGSEAELRRAVGLAWVKNVSAVDSSRLAITLSPRPDANVRTLGLTDPQIRTAIKDLASSWQSLASANLTVDVVNGVVSLRGTVPSFEDSWSAEAMVRSVVNVVTINNELRGPWWQPPPRVTPPERRRPRR